MERAIPIHDRFLPLLGFTLARRFEARLDAHDEQVVSYEHPAFSIAITSPRSSMAGERVHRRSGALHHLAFKADSRAQRVGA